MAMTATVLQNVRAAYPSMLDKWETRGSKYGLLDLGIKNATSPMGIITQDVIDKSKMSWGRTFQIPVMSPKAMANGTGMTCTITGTEAVSAFVTAVYVTISNAFQMQPQKNAQNEIKYQQEFARKYTDATRAIALAMDTAVDTALTANICPSAQYRSAYVGAGNRYPFTANVMGVALANQANFFNDLQAIMEADDIYGSYDIVTSTNGSSIIRQLFAQGQANDVNTQYQFVNGALNFNFSNRVTLTPATSTMTAFAMPQGSYALVGVNQPACLDGLTTTDGVQYGILNDPTVGIPMDNIYFSRCADISALSGNAKDIATVQETHQMQVTFAILVPYVNYANSANPAVIKKLDFLKV